MSLSTIKNELRLTTSMILRRPFQCLVQVTNRCNMRCDFCDFWPNGVAAREEVSIQQYRELSLSLSKIGSFLVSLEGGEPFVRSDLVEIVQAFSKFHIPLLFTNGWHVTPEISHELFKANLSQVGVSIDYPDAKRHDARRGVVGAYERAWNAVEHLKSAAPRSGKQVHVMTVLMQENQEDIEDLLRLSSKQGVGHCITLISTNGFRRGTGGNLPQRPISDTLVKLWKKYPHMRIFKNYFSMIDTFLQSAQLPTCTAGSQSFNIDHVGNVSPCIEKIGSPFGNIKNESLEVILAKMKNLEEVRHCQDCWTLCRGVAQLMGNGGSLQNWRDLAFRRESV